MRASTEGSRGRAATQDSTIRAELAALRDAGMLGAEAPRVRQRPRLGAITEPPAEERVAVAGRFPRATALVEVVALQAIVAHAAAELAMLAEAAPDVDAGTLRRRAHAIVRELHDLLAQRVATCEASDREIGGAS